MLTLQKQDSSLNTMRTTFLEVMIIYDTTPKDYGFDFVKGRRLGRREHNSALSKLREVVKGTKGGIEACLMPNKDTIGEVPACRTIIRSSPTFVHRPCHRRESADKHFAATMCPCIPSGNLLLSITTILYVSPLCDYVRRYPTNYKVFGNVMLTLLSMEWHRRQQQQQKKVSAIFPRFTRC